MLTAVATDPGPVYAEGYRRRHRLGPSSSLHRSLERLIEREIVEYSPSDGYRVPDAFLRAWIRRLTGR
ncbi:MAG TPA: hypothetical protein VGW38_28450 [Chloroflexota bacterium]|nr:hypothetical protein [Chloroflexota bacterium]